MSETDDQNEAIRLAFAAKKNQYRDDPHFRLSSAGPLTWLHNVPGWFEVDAFYTRDFHPPSEVVAAVKACVPHPQHMISVRTGPTLPDGMTEQYARLGYKELPEPPQPLMRLRLSGAAPAAPAHEISCEKTGEGRQRYALKQAGKVVSTAEVVWADTRTIYLYAMQTRSEYRRLGLATALLTFIHQDAHKNGAAASILWSSPMGLPFYKSLGYEVVVTGHGFIPCTDANDLQRNGHL
jgi:GNAT superfamily N-acetyltransferase